MDGSLIIMGRNKENMTGREKLAIVKSKMVTYNNHGRRIVDLMGMERRKSSWKSSDKIVNQRLRIQNDWSRQFDLKTEGDGK